MNKADKRVFKDIYNYWKTLKSMGITEKQLIIKMNTFLDNVMMDIYPSYFKEDKQICDCTCHFYKKDADFVPCLKCEHNSPITKPKDK